MMFQSCIGTALQYSGTNEFKNSKTNTFADCKNNLENAHILTSKNIEVPTLLKPNGFIEKVNTMIENIRSIGHKSPSHLLGHHEKLQPLDYSPVSSLNKDRLESSKTSRAPSVTLTSERYEALIIETKDLLSKHDVKSITPITLNQEIRDHLKRVAIECAGTSLSELEDYVTTAHPRPQGSGAEEELTCLRDLLFSLKVLDFTFVKSDTFFILNLLNDYSSLSARDAKYLISLFTRQGDHLNIKDIKTELADMLNNKVNTTEAQHGLMGAFIELLNDPLHLGNYQRHISDLGRELLRDKRQQMQELGINVSQRGRCIKLALLEEDDPTPQKSRTIPLLHFFPTKSKLEY